MASDVTIEQIGHGVIYAGTLAAALTGIGAFIHFALIRPLRNFLRKEIVNNLVDIKDALEQTSNRLEDHIDQADARDNKIGELAEMFKNHVANGGHKS